MAVRRGADQDDGEPRAEKGKLLPWWPRFPGWEEIKTMPSVADRGDLEILVLGDPSRNKVQILPAGGYNTIRIKLPKNWDELMKTAGYRPLREFFLSAPEEPRPASRRIRHRPQLTDTVGIRYDSLLTDTTLYSLHPASLRTLFAEVETFARAQPVVFVGTAGSVLERTNASSFAFYAHQYYDALGRKRERYVAGPVGSRDAEAAAEDLRSRITDLKNLVPSLRLLGREGFQLVDARTFATIASLHNHGLFAAGALLVGSHAYGALLNRLGVRGAAYRTEDVDLARPARLAIERSEDVSLLEMLRSSGVEFVEVPQLDRGEPATSFKEKGRSTFQVDLLAPARGEQIGAIPIPELGAHAQTLPYLGYLLEESDHTAVIAREGCVSVRIPLPERFAVHKLIISSMRRGRDAKILKDRTQASVLCAALAELHPGAVEFAVRAVPRGARKHLRGALASLREILQKNHPRAWEELSGQAAR